MTEKNEKVPGGPTKPPGTPETIPMGECSRTDSQDHLSLRTESTVFSLARTESPWATALPRRAWKSHRPAIILISTGGSILLAGFVLSGLYFAEEYAKIVANTDQTINTTSTNRTNNCTTDQKTNISHVNASVYSTSRPTNETFSNTTTDMGSNRPTATKKTTYSPNANPPLYSTSTNETFSSNTTTDMESKRPTTTNQTTHSPGANALVYSTSANETFSSNTTNLADGVTRKKKTMYSLICGTIVGPPLVSIGLMVMMVGVVLIPVTREMRQQNNMKRLFSYKTQNVNV